MNYSPTMLIVQQKLHQVERQLRYKDKLRIFLLLITILSFTVGFVTRGSLDFTATGKELDEAKVLSQSSARFPDKLDVNYVERNLFRLEDIDPLLINYARARHLTPPPTSKHTYNLRSKDIHSDDITEWLKKLLELKHNGKFVEIVQGNDGEFQSRSLLLERNLNWEGIIIECNPMILPFLKEKRRVAWIADTCVSPSNKPGMTSVISPVGWNLGASVGQKWNTFWPTSYTAFLAPTLPLRTIIAASTEWKEIDYLNIDIPFGKDLAFLQALPNNIIFKVITVETSTLSDAEVIELTAALEKPSVGTFFYVNFMISSKRYATYVHKSIKDKIPVRNIPKT